MKNDVYVHPNLKSNLEVQESENSTYMYGTTGV